MPVDETTIGAVAAAVAAVATVLNTFLQRRTAKKVNETHTQTTKNGHRHDPPTIPDMLSTLTSEVRGLHKRMDDHERLHKKK